MDPKCLTYLVNIDFEKKIGQQQGSMQNFPVSLSSNHSLSKSLQKGRGGGIPTADPGV